MDMTSKPTTDRQLAIEQVAEIMVEQCDIITTYEEAEAINDGDGWSFEARWPSNEYISEQDCTRMEGYRLNEEALATAWAISQRRLEEYAVRHKGELQCWRPPATGTNADVEPRPGGG